MSGLLVARALEAALARDPHRLALADDTQRLSFLALEDAVRRATCALYGLGVREGDRVAACLPNGVEIVVAFLAAQRLGALWVGIAEALAPPEKAHIVRDAGVSVCLSSPASRDAFVAAGAPTLREIIEVGPPEAHWTRLCAEASPELWVAALDPHAPAAIAYTSGTTGFPKGAVHSQHNLMLMGFVARAAGFYPSDLPHGVMLPLTTLNLLVLVPLVTLQNAAPCIVLESHKAPYLSRRVREERIGHLTAVPAIYHDLFHAKEVHEADLASLVRPEIGGAHVPPAIRSLYVARFHREVCIGYGMTEAPATVTRTSPEDVYAPGLCGRPLPHLALEIRDAQDRPLGAGQVGEICVRARDDGPFGGLYRPMLGYWNNPSASAEAVRDGRYYTGDLGCLDDKGQLFVMGRKKEMIVRGGANVYPAEVERVLSDCDGVAAAAVVGLPDDRLGERVEAFVQMRPGAAFSEDALRAACGRSLARYKVPARIHPIEEMPRNAMGKIVKARLPSRPG